MKTYNYLDLEGFKYTVVYNEILDGPWQYEDETDVYFIQNEDYSWSKTTKKL